MFPGRSRRCPQGKRLQVRLSNSPWHRQQPQLLQGELNTTFIDFGLVLKYSMISGRSWNCKINIAEVCGLWRLWRDQETIDLCSRRCSRTREQCWKPGGSFVSNDPGSWRGFDHRLGPTTNQVLHWNWRWRRSQYHHTIWHDARNKVCLFSLRKLFLNQVVFFGIDVWE